VKIYTSCYYIICIICCICMIFHIKCVCACACVCVCVCKRICVCRYIRICIHVSACNYFFVDVCGCLCTIYKHQSLINLYDVLIINYNSCLQQRLSACIPFHFKLYIDQVKSATESASLSMGDVASMNESKYNTFFRVYNFF